MLFVVIPVYSLFFVVKVHDISVFSVPAGCFEGLTSCLKEACFSVTHDFTCQQAIQLMQQFGFYLSI
jgi:hypothetical protein